MIQYYTPRVGGLQTLWNGYYILSELRIASDLVFPVYYEYSVSVQKLLALSSDTTVNRAKPTIREIQNAGYSLERLTVGMLGGSLDPLIADVTGMSPAPTVADFYSQISRESEKRPTIQQLYNTFGLQTLFDNLTVFDGVSPNRGMNLIKTSLSPQTTVAQWLALSSKPTVQQLFSNGQYGLQALWDGIADVETIYNGLATKPTVAQWWALTPGKPTVYQLSVIYGLQELWNGISSVATIKSGISPTVTQWWALGPKPTIDQLFLGSYSLQELWDYFASVSVVYDALSSKPTVAQWWALSTNTILHLLKPTVAQLSVRYVLRDLWGGIVSANRADDVAIIKAGLTVPPTVAEWTALTPTPTVNQLYGGGYVVAELISGNTGIQISDVLSAVSGPSNSTSISIINNLKSVGYKINMPAPRIRAASYNSGSVNLTVFQRSADVAVEKYLFSYSNNGGQTWSEYAVVTDSTSSAAEKPPLLLNGSNILIISGFTATNKLNSFRIKAEGSEIQSTTSNTFKNVFF
jgi:aryl carrier-like protein